MLGRRVGFPMLNSTGCANIVCHVQLLGRKIFTASSAHAADWIIRAREDNCTTNIIHTQQNQIHISLPYTAPFLPLRARHLHLAQIQVRTRRFKGFLSALCGLRGSNIRWQIIEKLFLSAIPGTKWTFARGLLLVFSLDWCYTFPHIWDQGCFCRASGEETCKRIRNSHPA